MNGIVTPIISAFLSRNNNKDKVNFHNNIRSREEYYGVYLRDNPSNTESEVPILKACESHEMKVRLEDSSSQYSRFSFLSSEVWTVMLVIINL